MANVPMVAGQQFNKGDIIGDLASGGFVALQSGTVPVGGYRPGHSSEFVHYSLGYATSGLGPGGDGRILNPDGSAK